MGKRELVALLNLSSWCLVMVEPLFLPVPRGCLQFVIVAFPDHTHYFRILKKSPSNIRVSNSLDPDQARHYVAPDLGPNCLQMLSADKSLTLSAYIG